MHTLFSPGDPVRYVDTAPTCPETNRDKRIKLRVIKVKEREKPEFDHKNLPLGHEKILENWLSNPQVLTLSNNDIVPSGLVEIL